VGPPVFKTGVGARAPRRVRFPSASAWKEERAWSPLDSTTPHDRSPVLKLAHVRRRVALARTRTAAHDSSVDRPQTSYAWNDGTALACQVVGTSGPDPLFVPGSVSHLEVLWEEPWVHRFLTRFASFCRLIIMDPRGLGLSDRLTEIPNLEERVNDLLSVLDAAESDRATLFGNADTGPPCIAATVSHPDRVGGLILCGTYAKASWSDDYPRRP
jgi:hypothetical protein